MIKKGNILIFLYLSALWKPGQYSLSFHLYMKFTSVLGCDSVSECKRFC